MTSPFNMRRVLLLAAGLFLAASQVQAGGWTLPRGGWYVEEIFSHFQTDEDFNRHSERQKKPFSGVYTETVAKTYIEYGLRDRWNLSLSLPYRRARFVDDYNDLDNAGFRDLSTGVKWRWKAKPTVVSFAVTAALPTGYDPTADLPLGDARGNLEGRVFVSRQFKLWGDEFFADVELAKDRYAVPYYAELTHLPLPWLFTKFYLVGQDDWPTQPDGEDFMKWNLGIGFASRGSNAIMRSQRYKSISFSVFYGEIFKGRNSAHGRDVSLSVALVF